MFRRLLCLLAVLFCVVSCATAPSLYRYPARPSVSELERSTAALVAVDREGDPHIFCASVWISPHNMLTAGHCAAAAVQRYHARSTTPEFPYGFEINYQATEGGKVFTSYLVKLDLDHDLALLWAPTAPTHGSASLALFSPSIGEELHIVGHPGGIPWTYHHGYVAGYRAEDFVDMEIVGPFLQVSAPIFGGNSGGGAFDNDGALVGICSFTMRAPGTGYFIHLKTIRKFLE